jgi:hypothetical protein
VRGLPHARVRGDGLTEGEAAIMALWDGGSRDYAEIGARTGYGANYVEQVVGRFAISEQSLSAFDRMSAAGTASLLSALHQFHPETRRGCHP